MKRISSNELARASVESTASEDDLVWPRSRFWPRERENQHLLTPTIISLRKIPWGVECFDWPGPKSAQFFTGHEKTSAWVAYSEHESDAKIFSAPDFKAGQQSAPHITGWDGGGGVLPYMGYIGMCGPKGYGFSAVLVINRLSILGWFFGHK